MTTKNYISQVSGGVIDSTRLDWLIDRRGTALVMGSDERGWSVVDQSDSLAFLSRGCQTPREALDAAIVATARRDDCRWLMAVYKRFCDDRGLPHRSADELLRGGPLPVEVVGWLSWFVGVWDRVFSEDVATG